MKHAEILDRLNAQDPNADEVFRVVRSVAYFFQRSDTPDVESLDLIVRLIDRRAVYESTLSGVAE